MDWWKLSVIYEHLQAIYKQYMESISNLYEIHKKSISNI